MKIYWLLNDQLHRKYLGEVNQTQDLVLFIEALSEFRTYPYHKQRIFFLTAAMRNFAKELEHEGYQVAYLKAENIKDALSQLLISYENPKIHLSLPIDYSLKEKLQRIISEEKEFSWSILENKKGNFLFSEEELLDMMSHSSGIQESFYRKARMKKNILMDNNQKPIGGKWNYDASNRKPPSSIEGLCTFPTYPMNQLTKGALHDCEENFSESPGNLNSFHLPVTRKDSLDFIKDFVEKRLFYFGPYQDGMLIGQPFMFHSLISAHLNCGLIEPQEVLTMVIEAYEKNDLPLSSTEGFIRQILGWREYVRATYLINMPEYLNQNFFNHQNHLPAFYWSGSTDMNCLKEALSEVLNYGYSHHIQRLMILSNFANLIFVNPLEVSNWFNQMYTDSWDWVVVPNVIGMSTYADGGIMATKPYVSSGQYISKMSNYCKSCPYDIKEKITEGACPFNALYWNFMGTHMDKLKGNPRMGLIISQWKKMDPELKVAIQKKASDFQINLTKSP